MRNNDFKAFKVSPPSFFDQNYIINILILVNYK
jgi:hypothetical protein